MLCPFCGSSQVMVVNSRVISKGTQVWRRRKCLKCGGLYTTYEGISLSFLVVVKKSGRRQRYNRAKIYTSIYHSFLDKKNVDRGQTSVEAQEITSRVERLILARKKREITTSEIMEIIMNLLKKKAPDSLLRYVAYRKGSDPAEVKRVIRKYFR